MFTGIVEEMGEVAALDGNRLRIRAHTVLEDVRLGDSIAVNGCCLTLVAQGDGWWEADVSEETFARTSLRGIRVGSSLNLERAVRLADRLGGHMVQGHVDGVGEVLAPVPDLQVRIPAELMRYVVEKGSITVDGVSLTVVAPTADTFTVAIIPHTADVTTLGRKRPGDPVNIEVDVLAKYVEQLLAARLDGERVMNVFDDIEFAIAHVAAGGIVVVADDEARENEGDLIMAADAATPEAIAFFVRHTSGVICAALPGDRCDVLDLPLMVPPAANADQFRTAFTVTVDLAAGTTTGISAADRAATLRALAAPTTAPTDLNRPGHIFPLRARPGGVLERPGHTEAAVDLARLAGRQPAGVLSELVLDDGRMARLPELQTFARTHRLPLVSIADLITFRAAHLAHTA